MFRAYYGQMNINCDLTHEDVHTSLIKMVYQSYRPKKYPILQSGLKIHLIYQV